MRRRKSHRTAAVTVEFAIAAPILFLVIFTGVEFSRVNLIRNTMKNAAYEGARRGIVDGATAEDCRQRAQEILDIVSVRDAVITITPRTIDSSTKTISVSIETPIDANGYISPRFYLGKSLVATTSMPRESS